MEKLKEIEKRLSEIKAEMNNEGVSLEALEKECDELLEARGAILSAAERRSALLGKISAGTIGTEGATFGEAREERSLDKSSPEYRSAFLKSLRSIELSEIERRALTTASTSAGATLPTQTSEKIVEKAKQLAPVLEEIELFSIKGNVTVPAEGTTVEAQIHAQGAEISGDDDSFRSITLSGFEVTKLITISKSVEAMSTDAFELWLVEKISRSIAEKITKLIFFGTGTNEAQGINAIEWNAENSVTVAKTASLSNADITAAVGLLAGGYDAEAKWYMSKKTFYGSFYPLMNTGKNNLITYADGKYYVSGYPVALDERIPTDEAFLGNLARGYIANMPEAVTVTSQFVARRNAYDILGSAIFDGKVSATEAFVKIIKAAE